MRLEPVPLKRLLLPTLFTLGNAACGFAGLLCLLSPPSWMPPPLAIVPWCVFAGWFFDMFDGAVAKALGATSDFGGQLDSLCDAVTFGVLPALLVASAAGGFVGAGAGLLFLAAVLVRLARFNAENAHDEDAHLYFKGLSSPAGAMTLAAAVLASGWLQAHSAEFAAVLPSVPAALALVAAGLAALMVGTLRYADLPKHYARRKKPLWPLLPLLAAAALVPWPLGLLLVTGGYVLGGLFGWVFGGVRALAPSGRAGEIGAPGAR